MNSEHFFFHFKHFSLPFSSKARLKLGFGPLIFSLHHLTEFLYSSWRACPLLPNSLFIPKLQLCSHRFTLRLLVQPPAPLRFPSMKRDQPSNPEGQDQVEDLCSCYRVPQAPVGLWTHDHMSIRSQLYPLCYGASSIKSSFKSLDYLLKLIRTSFSITKLMEFIAVQTE